MSAALGRAAQAALADDFVTTIQRVLLINAALPTARPPPDGWGAGGTRPLRWRLLE